MGGMGWGGETDVRGTEGVVGARSAEQQQERTMQGEVGTGALVGGVPEGVVVRLREMTSSSGR